MFASILVELEVPPSHQCPGSIHGGLLVWEPEEPFIQPSRHACDLIFIPHHVVLLLLRRLICARYNDTLVWIAYCIFILVEWDSSCTVNQRIMILLSKPSSLWNFILAVATGSCNVCILQSPTKPWPSKISPALVPGRPSCESRCAGYTLFCN